MNQHQEGTMGIGVNVIERLALRKGVFRERDVEKEEVSPSCLEDARALRIVVRHGHGVWSHRNYKPTRYEIVQIRLESAVFWGPSALWLHGVTTKEPDALWIAIGNNAKRPATLELDTVFIRSRNLERDVTIVYQPDTMTELRVHSRERAEADVARMDLSTLQARELRPRRFTLAPNAEFLSPQLRAWKTCAPYPEPPEDRRNDPEFDCRVKRRDEWSIARALPPAHESRGHTR